MKLAADLCLREAMHSEHLNVFMTVFLSSEDELTPLTLLHRLSLPTKAIYRCSGMATVWGQFIEAKLSV